MSWRRSTMTRVALVRRLADSIESLRRPHPLRVAIDGADAAGKTTLADELASVLSSRGRDTIRASIDDFHRPQAERYRRGEDSPEGYYKDSFDYPALRRELLDRLGPGGDRTYRWATFDFESDSPRFETPSIAFEDAILLFDGVFSLRPELISAWDLRIFVSVEFDEVLRRALNRDAALFGSPEDVEQRYRRRYIPGQELYFATAHPTEKADLIVYNDDPAKPVLETVVLGLEARGRSSI